MADAPTHKGQELDSIHSIVSVVITYQPNLAVLAELIAALNAQGTCVLVVDNGSAEKITGWNASQTSRAHHVIELGSNYGIAYAHNIGIDWARAQGARYVLLMDQDSIPTTGMVAALLQQAEQVDRLAAVGPRYVDSRRNNPPPFLQVKGLRLFRHSCSGKNDTVPVDYLISSGSLIPLATLAVVGNMREDLFIDYVDVEWGLRARHHGYQSYGVCFAKMEHSLGDSPIEFFGRKIPAHSALRHYYHFRNALLLYRSSLFPLNWKIVDGSRLFLRYGFYTLFAKPRFSHWKMMTLGLFHGLINRGGKYQP